MYVLHFICINLAKQVNMQIFIRISLLVNIKMHILEKNMYMKYKVN